MVRSLHASKKDVEGFVDKKVTRASTTASVGCQLEARFQLARSNKPGGFWEHGSLHPNLGQRSSEQL